MYSSSAREIDRFNIRVYGICIKNKKVLLVKENMAGFEFTKFPGGGLEFGEGLKEGLKREIFEEIGLDSKITSHFYTTDFFQKSAFKSNEQLISIYYFIEIKNLLPETDFPLETEQADNHKITFFWQALDTLKTDDVTFAIDKLIVEKLKEIDLK